MIIKIFFQISEHNPQHIHCIYGEYNGAIDIKDIKLIEGDLPQKALAMALEWTTLHQEELLKIWETQEFKKLPPLE